MSMPCSLYFPISDANPKAVLLGAVGNPQSYDHQQAWGIVLRAVVGLRRPSLISPRIVFVHGPFLHCGSVIARIVRRGWFGRWLLFLIRCLHLPLEDEANAEAGAAAAAAEEEEEEEEDD